MTLFLLFNSSRTGQLIQWSPPTFFIPLQRRNPREIEEQSTEQTEGHDYGQFIRAEVAVSYSSVRFDLIFNQPVDNAILPWQKTHIQDTYSIRANIQKRQHTYTTEQLQQNMQRNYYTHKSITKKSHINKNRSYLKVRYWISLPRGSCNVQPRIATLRPIYTIRHVTIITILNNAHMKAKRMRTKTSAKDYNSLNLNVGLRLAEIKTATFLLH